MSKKKNIKRLNEIAKSVKAARKELFKLLKENRPVVTEIIDSMRNDDWDEDSDKIYELCYEMGYSDNHEDFKDLVLWDSSFC